MSENRDAGSQTGREWELIVEPGLAGQANVTWKREDGRTYYRSIPQPIADSMQAVYKAAARADALRLDAEAEKAMRLSADAAHSRAYKRYDEKLDALRVALEEAEANVADLEEGGAALSEAFHRQHEELVTLRAHAALVAPTKGGSTAE